MTRPRGTVAKSEQFLTDACDHNVREANALESHLGVGGVYILCYMRDSLAQIHLAVGKLSESTQKHRVGHVAVIGLPVDFR